MLKLIAFDLNLSQFSIGENVCTAHDIISQLVQFYLQSQIIIMAIKSLAVRFWVEKSPDRRKF